MAQSKKDSKSKVAPPKTAPAAKPKAPQAPAKKAQAPQAPAPVPPAASAPAAKAQAPAAAPAPQAAKASGGRGPFPWHDAQVPAGVSASFGDKFLDMHRRELKDRASMLRRLGYPREETLRRCEAYAEWEFEPFHSSPLHKEIAALVDEAYAGRAARVGGLLPSS